MNTSEIKLDLFWIIGTMYLAYRIRNEDTAKADSNINEYMA
jgi:hypothetical protein